MDYITSKENKIYKQISKLNKASKYRKSEGFFVVEGIRLCDDALRSGAQIETCLFTKSMYDKHKDKIDSYMSCVKSSFCCENSIFSGVSDTKTPQGVLFVVKTLDKSPYVGKINKYNGIILALESIQDPTNLGTILRSAEAFGVENIVLSEDCCDIYSPKVVRGSMGAIFRTNFEIVSSLCSFINEFNCVGASYAAILDDEAKKLSETKFDKPCCVVIGNEGNGLSTDTINACSNKIFIDMKGQAESLNASVAASIILWEMSK